MSTIKSMKIISIETAKDTLVPGITIQTDSNLCGVGATFENAIRDIIIEEYAEDWKQINAMSLVDLAKKYGICVTNEVYTKWKDVPDVDNGEFKALPIMDNAHPILLTEITNCSDGDFIKVKATFSYRDELCKYQASNVGELIFQVVNDVYGTESVTKRAENKKTITELMEVFGIVAARNFQPIHLFNKSFTTFIGEAYRLAGIELKGTKQPMKPTKLGRITLQDIDLNPNKDWVVSLTIENELTAPFNIKYVVTSRNNTESPHRYDSVAITAGQILNSFPLTMNKETELRRCGDEKFREHFTLVTATHLKSKAFPKNNHGAQMLNLLAWFETVPAQDAISALVKVLFETDAWDVDLQGMKNISGKAEDGEVSFRVCHAVGSFFVDGSLETTKIRIFKKLSSVQLYIKPVDGVWSDFAATYNDDGKKDFENHLRGIVKTDIFNRNNQSK